MIAEVNLGNDARAWLIGQLELGHELARSVLHVHAPNSGHVVALLKPDTPEEWYHDFEVTDVVFAGAWEHLAQKIKHHLTLSTENCVVVEDTLAKPTDPALGSLKEPRLFFYGDHVYHLLDDPQADIQRIVEQVSAAGFYPTIGVFSSKPKSLRPLKSRSYVAADMFHDLAQSATAVFVAAYDEVSWLIWYLGAAQ